MRRTHRRRVASVRRRHAATMRRRRTPRRYLGTTLRHACEGSSLTISCPANYVIQVLGGFYGRRSNSYCARGPRKTYKCSSGRANGVIRSKCNNKRSCRVSSSNKVFGDPCRGTYKYMTVRYRCRLATSVVRRFASHRARLARLHSKRLRAMHKRHRRGLSAVGRRLSRARRGSKRCVRRAKKEKCPWGYHRRGRACVKIYRVCPRTFFKIRTRRGVLCIKFHKICKIGRFMFNDRCWRRCPKGTRKSSVRSCKLVKSCPRFLHKTRCVKSCPRNYVTVGRRCRRCPKNSFRRGNRCFRRRIFCRSGFAYRRRCVRTCPKHTYAKGRKCLRARCPPGSKTRFSTRRRRIVCIRRRTCKARLVYYGGSCKSKCPKGTRKRSWYCLKSCRKGYMRVGFRRQKCIKAYCFNRFRIGRSCVKKCPIGYIGVRRTCRRVTISCPKGYARLGRVLCLRDCPAGFTKRSGRCAYSTCRKGTFRYRGTCMKGCPAGTIKRGRYCFRRSKCRFGRFAYSKKCLAKCPPGHYRSFARRACVRIKRCGKGLIRFRRLCLKSCPLGFERKKRTCRRTRTCRNGKVHKGSCIGTRCPSGTRAIRGTCVPTPRLCPSGLLLLIRSNGARSCVRSCPRFFTAVRSLASCKRTRCPRGTYRLGNVCRKTCPKGFRARRGRCVADKTKCKTGLLSFRGRCIKRCPSGFKVRGKRCRRVRTPKCRKGTFRFRGRCLKKCPKGYMGRTFRRRGLTVRQCRRSRVCKKGQALIYERFWSRRSKRYRYRSKCVNAKKPCRRGFVLKRRALRFSWRGRTMRRVVRLCKRARDTCPKGLFMFRAKCRKRCPRGMKTMLVRKSRNVVRTCTPKCGGRYALKNGCVRKCPRGYSPKRFGRVRFCKKECSKGRFAFRGRCISRCPAGYRKRAYRVYSRGARRVISFIGCSRTKCRKGYKMVYLLKKSARGRAIKLTRVCSRRKPKKCRYPSGLAFGRCYRRCPFGYYKRTWRAGGRKLAFCLPTRRTRLCRRLRCAKSHICVIVRRTRVFKSRKRAVRRTVHKAICAPRFCKSGRYRYKNRCVRRCPRGYSKKSTRRFRVHRGRKRSFTVRRCTRKLCRYPSVRFRGRCVKNCPSTYDKKVYSFRFRYRRSKIVRRYAVCRRNLCAKVKCSRGQKCIVKRLRVVGSRATFRQVALCASKNACSKIRCRSGYKCRMKRRSGRRRPTCVPSVPMCRAGLVRFRRRCQRRCPRRYRVLSQKLGGRLYRRCVRDACSKNRFLSIGRCVKRCPTGFVGRAIRYSKSYSFKYCAPKHCKRRRFRLGRRCIKRCPSGYRRRYYKTRRGVSRYCVSSACRKGTYKLGRRCVKSCPKNYNKKTVRRGSKSYGACVPKKCPGKSIFIKGRCRKALKGCYDRTFVCKSMARRKKCSNKLVKYLCPVACGKCDPKKRKLCTCTSMGDPHYRTFDGQWIHFMGKCKYLLAKSTLRKSSKCNFSVTAKNEVRGKRRNVSWTRFVDISIHGIVIRLHQKRRVFLNGKRVPRLPISLYKKGRKLRVYRSGNKVVAESKYCGLYVEFNGRSVAELHLPKSRFAGKVQGICGNCNGNAKDDLKTRSGKDVSKLGSKGFVKIGQSYLVSDDSAKKYRCAVRPAPSTKCSKSMQKRVKTNKFCGLIVNKKGPFGACLKSGKVRYIDLFKNCKFDVCQYKTAKDRRRAVCQALDALYDACLTKGFRVSWRSHRFCPMKCGVNAVFKRRTSGCPRTCADVGRKRKCRLPAREGCACKKGFVLNDKKCVLERRCGKVVPLDLAFILDGTDDVTKEEFEALKNMVVKLLTKYSLSFNSVRPAIAVFGRTNPTVSLFSRRPEKAGFMSYLGKLKKSGGSADNLDDALRVANMVMMKPIGGARPEVPKYLLLLKKSTVPATSESAVRNELKSLKKANVHVMVVNIPPKKPGKTETEPALGGVKVIRARMPPYPAIPKITKELEKTAGCPTGFRKKGKRCRDVNECAAKVSPCHSDSTCVNLPGSYVCLCRAGLRHDRTKGCVPKKEKPKCPSKPKCDNGYYFDEAKRKCVDIDECKENPCLGKEAKCVNTAGSFKCDCKTGFQYSKYFGCVDVDECKGKDPCAGAGKCVNTLGSFKCSCDEGYAYKTGVGCKDIDECATSAHSCKGSSKCVNTVGSHNCSCSSGLRYVKNDCVDIDECAENSKLCDTSATCVNQKPGYKCLCKLGKNWVHKAGKGCVPDESKGLMQRKVDFIFAIDGSNKLKSSEKDIKKFLISLLNEFNAKEIAGLSVQASAIVMGQNGTAAVKFSQAHLSGIEDKIRALVLPGGKANLLQGMRKAAEEKAKARKGSTPIVFLITSASIKPGDVKLPQIKRHADDFKSTGKFFTVQISPAGEPADWSALYSGEEISHYVTVIRSSYISTIYKLIYKRIYPLINCPAGFVKVDSLCQLQTATLKYCKTEGNQLRPLGSTWQEECSQFKCGNSGIQVLSRKCLGYDGQCYSTEEYFPCTQVTGSLSWKCRCKIYSKVDKTGKKVESLHYQSIAASKEVVMTEKGRQCMFPFKYRSRWFYNCDEYGGRYWCSFNRVHKTGSWGYCKIKESKNRCTDPFNPKKVYVEGERWNHGCNVMECTKTGLKRIPKCQAADKTCKALNDDGYSCIYGGKRHSNCICVQDSAGWGKNEIVSGDKAKKVSSSGGSLISVCVDRSTGKQYEQGTKWSNSCFKYKCTSKGGELLHAACQQKDGKCREMGTKGFACTINGKSVADCECAKDSAGNPTLTGIVAGRKMVQVLKVSEVSTSTRTKIMAKKISSKK